MTGRTIDITLDVQDAQAVAAWQRSRQSIAGFHRELDQVDGKNKRNKSSSDSYFSGLTGNLGRAALGFAGVGSAIGIISTSARLLFAELENIRSRQKEAAQVQLGLPGLETQLFKNVGVAPEIGASGVGKTQSDRESEKVETGRRIIGIRDQIREDTDLPTRVVTDSFANALSARGNASVFQAQKATTLALQSNPDDLAAASVLSGAALDLGRAGATPEQALGFLDQAGSKLRLQTTKDIGKNLTDAIVSARNFGDNEVDATALFSAFTFGTNDLTGEKSTSAQVNLLKQLEKRFPDLDGFVERRQALIDNPEEKAKFLSKLSIEAKAFPTARALFDPSSEQSQIFDAGRRDLPTFEESADIFRANLKGIRSLPSAQLSALDRTFKGGTDRLQASDDTASGAVVREGLSELLKAGGASNIDQKISALKFDFSTSVGQNRAIEYAQEELRSRADRLRSTKEIVNYSDIYGSEPIKRNAPTSQELRAADEFSNVANKLETLIERLSETQNINVRVNGRAAENDQRTPSGQRPAASLGGSP